MLTLHFDAVKARLAADTTLTVYDSEVPQNADGTVRTGAYAVLYGGSPETLDDEHPTQAQRANSTQEYVYTVRSVAPDPAGVRAVATHVQTQLAGYVLTVTGRTCDPLRLTDTDDGVTADRSLKPALFYMDDEYTLISRPST